MKFKRVLIKLSGESLKGNLEFGFDKNVVKDITEKIKSLVQDNIQVVIVVGGGNIMRGKDLEGHPIGSATADSMGMIATIMNGLYLQDSLKHIGIENRVMSAIEVNKVAEPYLRLKALKHLDKGRVVIVAAGTGNPYSSTDSAATLRARELECDLIIKATQVNGVYNKDPNKFKDAVKYEILSYDKAIADNLQVMDTTAFTSCRDSKIPILVCSIQEDSLLDVANGSKGIGTLVNYTGCITD